ncbi:MAG: hypothetical protein F6K10_34765, partial [Moorea sp. SIO2B7]|nr:hypothetical protein [Moorena sp. SIO2B7]
EAAAIRKHEETHIKRLHSIDILFVELIHIIMWFNPIIHLYKKSLQSIHEYEADQAALQTASYPKYGQILLVDLKGSLNASEFNPLNKLPKRLDYSEFLLVYHQRDYFPQLKPRRDRIRT